MAFKIKGFIFTLDAVFALILTSFVVSIILYLHFAPQVPAQLQSPDSASILNFLVSQPISSMNLQHITQAARQNSWPQFGNSNITFLSQLGLNALMLAFQYKATNSISTLPVIDNGTVFLGTENGQIIELNSSSGSLKKNFVVANSNVVAVSSTVAYSDIIIHNSQSQATPAPFQQIIQFNSSKYIQYETQNLGNIRFYLNGQELYSWCESGCSVYANAIIQIPITLHNSQSQATPAPFQQMITVNALNYSNYEATNLGNIRFYLGQQELYSWCESNCSSSSSSATFWIKLPNGIPAQQSVTVNMTFEPKTVNYDGVYAGEAPQLSATYGQYDNGANVFNNYWNFAGTSLPSGWAASNSIGYLVDNGLAIGFGSVYSTNQIFSSLNNVLELYGNYPILNSANYSGISQSNSIAPQGSNTGGDAEILWMTDSGTNEFYAWAADGSTTTYNIQGGLPSGFFPTLNTHYIFGTYVNSTSVGESINYKTIMSAKGTFNTNQYILLGSYTGANTLNENVLINPIEITWLRTRAYSPNGVMPTVSFGNSNTTFWIKLPNGIPASSSVTVNMTFEPKTVNYDGVYAGEAPQLSPSYGEYDNGASVFNFYDNFVGSALSNKWIPNAITYSINDGFTATATGPSGYIYSKSYKINPANSIADFFGTDYQFNDNWTGTGFSNPSLNIGDGSWIYGYTGNVLGGQGSSIGSITNAGNIINSEADQVFSIISVGPIVSNYSINYLKQVSTSGTPPSYPLYPTLLTAYVNNAAYTFTNPVFVQWYRVRAYPPGDKMPVVSIGAVQVPSVTSMPPIESIVSYKGLIAVANNTAIVGIENNHVIWKISVSASTPLAVEDNYLIFGSGDVLYFYYINGTQAISYILPQKAMLPVYHNGEFIESTSGSSTNYLIGLAHVKNSLIQIFSSQLQTGETTEPAIDNQSILVGSSKSLYSFYFNGLPVWPTNSITLPTQIQSIATLNKSIFVQTSNSIFVVNATTGRIIQSISMPTSNNNATLSLSLNPKELFAIPNSNYFYGFNITSKGTLKHFFNVTLPQTSSTTLFNYSEVALAGNNAYLISNNTLYAFGSCYLGSHITTAFSAAAYFYLTGQGGCADFMLFNEINATDSGIFINKTYGPSIDVATFNGHSSLITNYNKALLNNQPNFTIAAWIYINSFKYNSHLGTSTIYSEGNPFVRLEFYPSNWSINNNGALGLETFNSSTGKSVWIISNAIIPINEWTFVGGQLLSNKSGSYFILYINGLMVKKSKGLEEINSGANEITIGGLSPLANGGLPAFNGSIANLQIYNTSLTENQIGQIYSEGIGGIPISNAGLLAWYPLQGNANDYSGNNNVGFSENVTYTNKGYVPASLKNTYSKSVSSMQLNLNINGTNKLYNISVITWH